MKKNILRFCTLFFLSLACFTGKAQFNRYLIRFDRKLPNNFQINQPSTFLSQKAIERRTLQQIQIDSSDLPIIPYYLDSILHIDGVQLLSISKWLNQAAVLISDPNALLRIQQLPFVVRSTPIAARSVTRQMQSKFSLENESISPFPLETLYNRTSGITNEPEYGASKAQTKIHQGEFLHKHGLKGKGMNIAVIDAGFLNHNTLPTFDSIRTNGQLVDTWDFVAGESSVSEDDYHGTHCLSTIAANQPGRFVGTAPESNFLLYRSEDVATEYPIEEHHFAAALERADSAGANLCTVSLGYTVFSDPSFDYTYADMNGNSTISAIAADIASKKGLLMVIAIGNEGQRNWRYLITPADADSCLSVGSIDSLGVSSPFSSFGPSSDGDLKPSVAAVGRNAVIANAVTGNPQFGSGTSYATPIMAGLVTCLWQAFPKASNMTIIDVLQKNASRSDSPNIRMGYGIPNLKKSFISLQKKYASLGVEFRNCKNEHSLTLVADSNTTVTIEKKIPGGNYEIIHEWNNNVAMQEQDFTFFEDLNGTNLPSMQYRYTVTMDGDTSYILDSSTVIPSTPCIVILPSKNTLSITPNPATDFLYLNWERQTAADVKITILNGAGQKTKQQKLSLNPGIINNRIDLGKYAPGLYIICIEINDEKPRIEKFIVL
jgi:hypothetical protein